MSTGVYSQLATPVDPDAVIAPGTLTDNRVIRGAGGKEIQDSGVTLNDNDVMSGLTVILDAGTAVAGTAPLKFTSGTNLTAPEAGAIEYDGAKLTYTDGTSTRRPIVTGPSSSTNNAAVRWNSTTGTLVKNSTFIIDDNGAGFSSTASTGNVTASLINTGTGTVRLNLQPDAAREAIFQLGTSTDWTIHNSTTDFFQVKKNSTTVFAINPSGFEGIYTNGRFKVTRTTANDTELVVENQSTGGGFLKIETQAGGAFADPFVIFTISSTSYTIGLDNSDSDVLSINKGSSPSAGTQIVRCDGNVWQNNIGAAIKYSSSAAVNASLTSSSCLHGVTNTGAARTISLPNTGMYTGQIFIIVDESGGAGTNNITVDVTGGVKTINGALTQPIATNYGSLRVYYNGTNYFTF